MISLSRAETCRSVSIEDELRTIQSKILHTVSTHRDSHYSQRSPEPIEQQQIYSIAQRLDNVIYMVKLQQEQQSATTSQRQPKSSGLYQIDIDTLVSQLMIKNNEVENLTKMFTKRMETLQMLLYSKDYEEALRRIDHYKSHGTRTVEEADYDEGFQVGTHKQVWEAEESNLLKESSESELNRAFCNERGDSEVTHNNLYGSSQSNQRGSQSKIHTLYSQLKVIIEDDNISISEKQNVLFDVLMSVQEREDWVEDPPTHVTFEDIQEARKSYKENESYVTSVFEEYEGLDQQLLQQQQPAPPVRVSQISEFDPTDQQYIIYAPNTSQFEPYEDLQSNNINTASSVIGQDQRSSSIVHPFQNIFIKNMPTKSESLTGIDCAKQKSALLSNLSRDLPIFRSPVDVYKIAPSSVSGRKIDRYMPINENCLKADPTHSSSRNRNTSSQDITNYHKNLNNGRLKSKLKYNNQAYGTDEKNNKKISTPVTNRKKTQKQHGCVNIMVDASNLVPEGVYNYSVETGKKQNPNSNKLTQNSNSKGTNQTRERSMSTKKKQGAMMGRVISDEKKCIMSMYTDRKIHGKSMNMDQGAALAGNLYNNARIK